MPSAAVTRCGADVASDRPTRGGSKCANVLSVACLVFVGACALLSNVAGGDPFPAARTVLGTSGDGAERFDIAVTVDDLPSHGPLPPGATRADIARSFVATFKQYGVPQPFGFVNARKIAAEPDSGAVLAIWRRAGFPLGNHTYSHLNAARAPLAEWQADVIAGEPAVAAAMAGRDWRWLRFPNLASGADAAAHDAILAFVTGRGYRIAEVSVAFSDWSYSEAYARCLANRDDAAVLRMTAQYLKGVDDGIAAMKAMSRPVYGRLVPQVLLTHIGGFSAATLPATLARLRAAGARFVTLEQAQADPAYADAIRLPGGGSIIDRTARARAIVTADIPKPAGTAQIQELCR